MKLIHESKNFLKEVFMSKQSFSDESNWKHEPHAEHYVKDKFGKGSTTWNWKKNLDPKIEPKG